MPTKAKATLTSMIHGVSNHQAIDQRLAQDQTVAEVAEATQASDNQLMKSLTSNLTTKASRSEIMLAQRFRETLTKDLTPVLRGEAGRQPMDSISTMRQSTPRLNLLLSQNSTSESGQTTTSMAETSKFLAG
jgi:hypothetical protein